MRKSKPSKSDGDEHVQSEGDGSGNLQEVSNYEMQRLKRIEENKKRMEALGLRKMANSLMGSVHKAQKNNNEKKGKKKMDEEDDEYTPDQDDEPISSSSEDIESDEKFSISENKARKKKTTPKKRGSIQKKLYSSDFVDIDADDEALMQAIALSLQDTTNAANDKRKELPRSHNDSGMMKRKKPIGGRIKMTEDEMLVHFFQFDETGKGRFTVRDVQRLATAHDFTWSEKELADMICCFDTDGDGKINYDDFCKIVGRCNMLNG